MIDYCNLPTGYTNCNSDLHEPLKNILDYSNTLLSDYTSFCDGVPAMIPDSSNYDVNSGINVFEMLSLFQSYCMAKLS